MPPLPVVQVKELVKKNFLEDKRNCKRTTCEHCCPLVLLLLVTWSLGTATGQYRLYGSGGDVTRPGAGGQVEVFHQVINSYLFDPTDQVFNRNFRTGLDTDPCGSCDRVILLQGAPAQDFKAFAEKLWSNRVDDPRRTACSSRWGSTGMRQCLPDAPDCCYVRDAASACDSFRVVDRLDAGQAACAAVRWDADAGQFTIRLNRTFGFWNDRGEFTVSSQMPEDLSEPWGSQPQRVVTVDLLQSTRCVAKSNMVCKRTGGTMYAPPRFNSYYSTSRDPSWFVALHMLLSEFADSKAGGPPPPGAGEPPRSYLFMPMPINGVPGRKNNGLSFGDSLVAFAEKGFGVISSIVFVVLFYITVGRIIEERELKLKEGLRMMGTSIAAYYGHWAVTALIFSLAYAFVVFVLFLIMRVFGSFYISLFFGALFFFMCISGEAFFLSCFFSVARTGSLIGTMLYFTQTFMVFIPITVPGGTLLMLIPQVAWCKLLKVLMTGDLDGWHPDMVVDGGLTVGGCVGWLILDLSIFLLLWVYFDLIIPHGGGNALRPWFLCDPGYWRGNEIVALAAPPTAGMAAQTSGHTSRSETELSAHVAGGRGQASNQPSFQPEVQVAADLNEPLNPARSQAAPRPSVSETMSFRGRNSLFEPVHQQLLAYQASNQCVKIRDLCVYFRGANFEEIRAVDGASLTMYPNEIFALLGHNGAGKSTTMSVLSGLLKPTSGEVTVFNLQVPRDMTEVRKSMGFCPQHDVLFKDLTVREHMELFCAITGRDNSDKDLMFRLCVDVGLGDRSEYCTHALSGGMKRKLSVGITFAGNPRLVILDEPTSGMDPFSRRVLWDFLKIRKEGRVLLLTTHFMDEADVLGDRIAIMRAGQVQTCGSPQYLKRKFGCGYVLTVVMKEQHNSHEPVKRLIIEGLGGASSAIEMSGVGKEILVNVPLDLEAKLPSTLEALSLNKDTYSIGTYGVSVTNLEEVFLKVASGDHGSKKQMEETEATFREAMDGVDREAAFVMPNPGGTIPQQILALLFRRFHSARRDGKAFMTGCLVPVFMLLAACMLGSLIVRSSVPSATPLPATEIALSDLKVFYAASGQGAAGYAVEQIDGSFTDDDFFEGSFNCWTTSPYSGDPGQGSQCRWLAAVDGCSGWDWGSGMGSCLPSGVTPTRPQGRTSVTLPYDQSQSQYPWGYLEKCYALPEVKAIADKYTWSWDTQKFNFLAPFCKARLMKSMVGFGNKMMDKGGSFDIGVLTVDGFTVVAVNNSHVAHVVPLAIKELYKRVSGMKVTNFILPRMAAEVAYWQRETVFFQFVASMVIAVLSNIAFCFVPIAVMAFVLMEKAKDVKHQLLISGCSPKAYWISMLMWDCLIALTPVAMLYVFLSIFGFDAFIKYAGPSLMLLLLFVPAAVGLAYVVCQLISSPAMGNTCLLLCNGMCALVLVVLFLALDVVPRGIALTSSFSVNPVLIENNTVINDRATFTLKMLNADCDAFSKARADSVNRNPQAGSPRGQSDETYFWSAQASMCKFVWYGKVGSPIVKAAGAALPGFNLLDGLMRISGRHAIVYLGIPYLLRLTGDGAESTLKRQVDDYLKGCKVNINPQAAQGDQDEDAKCDTWAALAAKDAGQKCAMDEKLDAIVDFFPIVPFLEAAAGSLDSGFESFKQGFEDRLFQAFKDALVSAGEDPAKAEQQARDEAEALVSKIPVPSSFLPIGEAGNITGTIKTVMSGLAASFLVTLFKADEREEWSELVTCLRRKGYGLEALTSVLSSHGDAVGGLLRDWFYKQAASPDVARFGDRTLPDIRARRQDVFGGSCDFGPELGPWLMGQLKVAGISLGSTIPSINGTSIGPISVTLPCNLGITGNLVSDTIGHIIETLVLIPTIGDSLLRLAVLAIIFPILVIIVEDLQQSPRIAYALTTKTPCPEHLLKLEDDSVKAEKVRVATLDPRKQIMYVKGLRKVFGGTHAVRGVTWAADQGMVFGLLGVNGAGKTTSFKMMSGILTPSDGEVRILGIDVVQDTSNARRFIGYCPQFDAIIDRMTVLEHLYLYGRMKGLVHKDLSDAVNAKVSEMQLSAYVDRSAGSLSGGNKRKLSVAMAVIGEPPVIFLDEPSTGMDPFARRFMWGVIQDVAEKRKQSVVVLTTHSMEEAEALCSSIAIQVDGQLRCLGSAQQLKSQYGQGYEVCVKFAPVPEEATQVICSQWQIEPAMSLARQAALQVLSSHATEDVRAAKLQAAQHPAGPLPETQLEVLGAVLAEWSLTFDKLKRLEAHLGTSFGRVLLLEAHGAAAKWRLLDMEESQLARLLRELQEGRADFGLSDYACSQATLEQIFNAFAAEQEAGGHVGIVQPPAAVASFHAAEGGLGMGASPSAAAAATSSALSQPEGPEATAAPPPLIGPPA